MSPVRRPIGSKTIPEKDAVMAKTAKIEEYFILTSSHITRSSMHVMFQEQIVLVGKSQTRAQST